MGTPAATGADLILKKFSCEVSGGSCQVATSLQQQVRQMIDSGGGGT